MATITQETRFDLLRNELVSLSNAQNYTLTCYRGELWITQEGDKRDIILDAGESYQVTSTTLVAISALKTSTLSVQDERVFEPQSSGRWGMLQPLISSEFSLLGAFFDQLICHRQQIVPRFNI